MMQNPSSGFSIQAMTGFLPIIAAIGVFAGLVTFLGRLYLEYYFLQARDIGI